jgi:hypothetical protein
LLYEKSIENFFLGIVCYFCVGVGDASEFADACGWGW